MELDRHVIERKDFSAARRGYDPEEVDAHLRELANAINDLKQSRGGSDASVAGAAADQVRQIVEAAEASATEIEREARDEARRVTDGASQAAQRSRQKADSEAGAHVQRVEEATDRMLERADRAQAEIDRLLDELRTAADGMVANLRTTGEKVTESLRSGAESLKSDLESIRASLGDVRPARADVMVDEAPAVDEAPTPPEHEAEVEADEIDLPVEEDEDVEAPSTPDGGTGGAEGARLIALNMVLNGTPREETERYLEENFDLDDSAAILDDVYARAGQAQ